MQEFSMIKEVYGEEVNYQVKSGSLKGNSTPFIGFTEKGWKSWAEKIYLFLLTYSGDKNCTMYKECKSLYYFICKYFKINLI